MNQLLSENPYSLSKWHSMIKQVREQIREGNSNLIPLEYLYTRGDRQNQLYDKMVTKLK